MAASSPSSASPSHKPAAKLVLIQYLFGLVVTEACRQDTVLGVWGQNVRLRWPNDMKEVGGVLATSFMGGNVELIIGKLAVFTCQCGS